MLGVERQTASHRSPGKLLGLGAALPRAAQVLPEALGARVSYGASPWPGSSTVIRTQQPCMVHRAGQELNHKASPQVLWEGRSHFSFTPAQGSLLSPVQTGGKSPEPPAQASRGHWAKPHATGAKSEGLNSGEGFWRGAPGLYPSLALHRASGGHSPEQPKPLSPLCAVAGKSNRRKTPRLWAGRERNNVCCEDSGVPEPSLLVKPFWRAQVAHRALQDPPGG